MQLPPSFEEAARCHVCNCSFNTFRRRHHCRCCGRTLCHEHSSYEMALPRFGVYSNVRVCFDCFNNSGRKNDLQSTSNSMDSASDEFSKLNVNLDDVLPSQPLPAVSKCSCGMPLCICHTPSLPAESAPQQKPMTSIAQSRTRQRKPTNSQLAESPLLKNVTSASNSKQSLFFNQGHTSNACQDKVDADYEATGEGLREAIKKHDLAAVKKLLNEGVDPNYRDKQGFSLLHLAALFNQTEIAFTLMDSGANIDCRNAQDEVDFGSSTRIPEVAKVATNATWMLFMLEY